MNLRKNIFNIYIPISKDKNGFDSMFNDIYDYLKTKDYNLLRNYGDKKYDVLLEPYPMDYYFKIKSKYRIKYKYSAISAKPNPVYKPENNIVYDAILCCGNYDSEFLKVYADVYEVGNLKYVNYKKQKHSKKNILYLPTFGDLNTISKIKKVKDDNYNYISKAHHGTNYLVDESKILNKLKEVFDEFYDSSTPLCELFEKTDYVISDNSGSIFEALYMNIPVGVIN